ncbi:MAG: hypothetical protein ACTHN5_02255 [Phycisphaerae bacterium]
MPPRTLARVYWLIGAASLTVAIVCSRRFISIPFPFNDEGLIAWIIAAAVIASAGTLVVRFGKDLIWATLNGQLSTIRVYVKNPEVLEEATIAADAGQIVDRVRERLSTLSFAVEERTSGTGSFSILARKPKMQDASGLMFNAMEATVDLTSSPRSTEIRVHLRLLGSLTGSVAIDYEQLRSVAKFIACAADEVSCDALPVTIDMALISGTTVFALGMFDQLHGRTLGFASACGAFGIVATAMACATLKRMRSTSVGWPAAVAAALLALWPALARLLSLFDARWLDPPTSWCIAVLVVAPLISVPLALAITGNRIPLPEKPLIPTGWTNVPRRRIFAGAFFAIGLFFIFAGASIVFSTLKMDSCRDVKLADAEKAGPLPVGWVNLHGWVDLDHYVWHTEDGARDNYLPLHGAGSTSADPIIAFLRVPGSKGEELALTDEEQTTAVSGIAEEEQLPTDLYPHLQREGIKVAPHYVILQYHLDPATRREGGVVCSGMGLIFAAGATLLWRWKGRKKPDKTQTLSSASSIR